MYSLIRIISIDRIIALNQEFNTMDEAQAFIHRFFPKSKDIDILTVAMIEANKLRVVAMHDFAPQTPKNFSPQTSMSRKYPTYCVTKELRKNWRTKVKKRMRRWEGIYRFHPNVESSKSYTIDELHSQFPNEVGLVVRLKRKPSSLYIKLRKELTDVSNGVIEFGCRALELNLEDKTLMDDGITFYRFEEFELLTNKEFTTKLYELEKDEKFRFWFEMGYRLR